jgi:hypothetical protein
MRLKAQDVLVSLKIAVSGGPGWSYAGLAHDLGLSPSQVHAAVKRANRAGLILPTTREVHRRGLTEFLVHGLKYVLPAERGPMTRGIPTSYAAAPLADHIVAGNDPPPVWPDAQGDVRGETFVPIHKAVPFAARRDPALHACLSLVDALRGGRARERKLAERLLKEALAR